MNPLVCDDKSWEEFPKEFDKIKSMSDEEFEQYLKEAEKEK